MIVGAALGVRFGRSRLPRTIVTIGSVIVALGAAGMTIGMNEGTRPLVLGLGLSVLGFGAGLIGSQIVNLILSTVPVEETAEASGVTSTLEQVGNSVGVAFLGTILTVSLSLGLSQMIAQSSVIPIELCCGRICESGIPARKRSSSSMSASESAVMVRVTE